MSETVLWVLWGCIKIVRAILFGSTCGGENVCLYEQLVMYLGPEKKLTPERGPKCNCNILDFSWC